MDRKRREGMLSWRNLRYSPGASVQRIKISKGRKSITWPTFEPRFDSRTGGMGIASDAESIVKFGPLQS
jgi:hypothetical protein